MRKKSINNFFDSLLWYTLYMLPILAYIFSVFRSGSSGVYVNLFEIMNSGGFAIITDGIIANTLCSLFGYGGVLPLFSSSEILFYASYVISVWILHLAVDVILWIVRFAHKLLDNSGV